MIVDHIRNRAKYYFLGEDYKRALDYFAAVSDTDIKEEDIEIEGTESSIKVRPLMTNTVENCNFETHRVYADIHFVVYGKERMGYTDIKNLELVKYDEKEDWALMKGTGDFITLMPGYFLIAFPDDGHMPLVCVDKPEPIGKMIAKIKL